MWLIILATAATLSTIAWYFKAMRNDKYMLRALCLILWGATIMVLIDRVMGYLMEGGELFDVTPEAAALGLLMLTAALALWGIILLISGIRK